MKKYTKPSVEIVELSVRESLSALPSTIQGFSGTKLKTTTLTGGSVNNVTVYKKTSAVRADV